MTNPIIECVAQTGLNLYAVEKNRITGQTGNNTGLAWEVFNAANWLQYAVVLAEDAGTGYYHAVRPTWLAGSLVTDVIYQRAGLNPAVGDVALTMLHNLGENVAAINADPATAAQNLQAALSTEIQGAVLAGTLTNSAFPTNLGALANNLVVGRTLAFTSGTLLHAACSVLAYNGSTGVVTVSPLVGAPAVNDTFVIF